MSILINTFDKPQKNISGVNSSEINKFLISFINNKTGIEMVFVKGGTFRMGCAGENGSDCGGGDCNRCDEKPTHDVTLSDYYIGKYPVTWELWLNVMDSSPSGSENSSCPVENVSWNEVNEFIQKLNTIAGRQYRLPTEAEWEFAARGGNKSIGYKYAGSDSVDDVAWYSHNSNGTTHPLGIKMPNELNIYDMSGNVWEWVNDLYGNYSSSNQTDPQGPLSGDNRVGRGGCWRYGAEDCRVSSRNGITPTNRNVRLGFRLAMSCTGHYHQPSQKEKC
jgi:formylglycine-generating enzyme required for sulfatase activity